MIIYGDLDLTIRGKPKPKQWFHNEHIETWNDMDICLHVFVSPTLRHASLLVEEEQT